MEGESSIDQKGDYWDVPLSDKQKENLDLDLIEELNIKELSNQAIDDESSQEKLERRRKKPVFRLIALLTLLAFAAIYTGSFLKGEWLPPLNILSQSGLLKQLPRVAELQKAVVLIDAVTAKGTGFNIDPAGLIVTNAHVVDQSSVIRVKFANGEIYQGTKWRIFPEVDLALIKIKGRNLPELDLAESSLASQEGEVMIIGNPLGFPFVVSKGEVAGKILLNNWTEPVLKIDSYINKGSSGSPVINMEGKVVGIIFAVLEASQNDETGKTTGFAISVDSLKQRLMSAGNEIEE